MFDTHLDGDPESIDPVTDWLTDLGVAYRTAAARTRAARGRSVDVWAGEAAREYRGFIDPLAEVMDELEERVESARQRFMAYKQQLQWALEDLAEVRAEAVRGTLTMFRTFVQPPPPAICPAEPRNPTPAEAAAYDQALTESNDNKIRAMIYERLRARTQEIKERLAIWVYQYLAPEELRVLEPHAVSRLSHSNAIGLASHVGADLARERLMTQSSDALREHAEKAVARAAERSGNPAVRAGAASPSDDAVARTEARMEEPRTPTMAARTLKWGVPVIDSVLVVRELASGASPSAVMVEQASAGLAGAGVGSYFAAASIAGPVPVVIVAATAWGAGYMARGIYETNVPQHARERIDRNISGMLSTKTIDLSSFLSVYNR